MKNRQPDEDGPMLTIGAVERATEVPANTLRTWERRYGFPMPQRTEGNQRLYDPEVVHRIRLIHRALQAGHRPAQVMRLDEDGLRRLLDGARAPAPESDVPGMDALEAWFSATSSLDGAELERLMEQDLSAMGLLTFLRLRVGPFVTEVGRRWAGGTLHVHEEHFATDRVRGLLARQWRTLSDLAQGSLVVCANLPEERHDLGLHMAACVAAMLGLRVVFLGADTPVESIAATARRVDAAAVLVSVAPSANAIRVESHLSALRSSLHEDIVLLVGGGGAPEASGGAERVTDLGSLAGRLSSL